MDNRMRAQRIRKFVFLILFLYNKIISLRFKIKGRNNRLQNISKCILKRSGIRISGNNNIIIFGRFSRFSKCSINIKGDDNIIEIGDHTLLHCANFYIEDNGNMISVGENTSIHGETHLAAIEGTTIDIGNDCMFSSNIEIRTGDSHSILDMSGNRINPSKNVVIGNHVWVGSRVIILKGSQISDFSIIGAGSIVSGKFSDKNIILAGVPAKMVKNNINWERKRL